jgi:ketosteroid isomerase-like protein
VDMGRVATDTGEGGGPPQQAHPSTDGSVMATRTPEEVFAHHGKALGAEDLEDIVADYSDDAILVVQKQVYRGKDGARQVFTQLLGDVPQAQWELETVFADDVLYLEWKAAGGGQHRGRHRHLHLRGRHDSGADRRLHRPHRLTRPVRGCDSVVRADKAAGHAFTHGRSAGRRPGPVPRPERVIGSQRAIG